MTMMKYNIEKIILKFLQTFNVGFFLSNQNTYVTQEHTIPKERGGLSKQYSRIKNCNKNKRNTRLSN